MELSRATFKTKEEDYSIPEEAQVLSKDTTVSVEEIENGYLIAKSTETKYQLDGRTDFSYHTKKYFSKKNPLEFKDDGISLADKMD